MLPSQQTETGAPKAPSLRLLQMAMRLEAHPSPEVQPPRQVEVDPLAKGDAARASDHVLFARGVLSVERVEQAGEELASDLLAQVPEFQL
jgi:hypothetical protein